MAWMLGAALVSGVMANRAQKGAAQDAAGAQTDAAQMGVEEQRRQFEAIQKLLSPYVQGGPGALAGQQDILGLNGAGAQQKAYGNIENSPAFGSMVQQGENALLQNASATGGLRGGNIQQALAKFRPELLSSLIDQQYSRLGGMTQLGQNSAVMQGNAGMNSANQISALYGDMGSAQAGGALGVGQANANMWGGLSKLGGMYASGAFGKPGGGTGATPLGAQFNNYSPYGGKGYQDYDYIDNDGVGGF